MITRYCLLEMCSFNSINSRFVYLVAALNEVQNVVDDSEKLGIEHTAGKRTPRHGNNYEEKNFE
ncbi:hypothetical protein NECAME_06568 [Necator americanus]|uniref:Uncharacterized protein n=1 Tax=Necator americanus TaxID=51031 RepID=W2TVM3_NECAM|nr:hypothetical protein NECAME_06568 [Necator americanus]ETN85102.1 hypothetical protein NECAME_06568 [Necator americanus]